MRFPTRGHRGRRGALPRQPAEPGPRSESASAETAIVVVLAVILLTFELGVLDTNNAGAVARTPLRLASMVAPHTLPAAETRAPSDPNGPTGEHSTGAGARPSTAPGRLPTTHRVPSIGPPLRRLPTGAMAPAALASSGSTSSNWLVTSPSEPGTLEQLGGSNRSLILVGYDLGPLRNSSSGFFATHGIVGISISRDGGRNWTTNWPGQNASWSSGSSVDDGDVLSGALLETFAYGVANTLPAVSLNASEAAPNVVGLSTYGPACYYTGCTASEFNASSGVAIVRSADGGTTWSAPQPISNQVHHQIDYLDEWPGGCDLADRFVFGPRDPARWTRPRGGRERSPRGGVDLGGLVLIRWATGRPD